MFSVLKDSAKAIFHNYQIWKYDLLGQYDKVKHGKHE